MVHDMQKQILNAVSAGDSEALIKLVTKIMESGVKTRQIAELLTESMNEIGKKWALLEIFMPEVIQSAESVKTCIDYMVSQTSDSIPDKGTIVLGTVKGDLHDIGKNIVAAMWTASGFKVLDIGIDQPSSAFIEAAQDCNADIIAASCLLTTALSGHRDIIDLLKTKGLRDKYKVLIGGGAVTQEWCDEVGADGYAKDAAEAVKLAYSVIHSASGSE